MQYVLLITGWTVYFTLHSVFASNEVKDRLAINLRVYRLVYTILSTVGLVALLVFNQRIGGEDLFHKTGLLNVVGGLIGGAGIVIGFAAFRNYSFMSFIGLKNEPNGSLVKSGINSWVRHPLYSGTILFTLGFFLYDPRLATLVTVCCIWIYLYVGIRLEEKKLVQTFGDDYRRYRKEVAAVIPYIL